MKTLKTILSTIVLSLFYLHLQASVVAIAWSNRFTGPNSSIFNSVGAIDVNGNVYVTGSTRVGFTNHIVTIKYNKDGVQQWTVIGDEGQGTAIVLDKAMNIYVTGLTIVNAGFDFVTIKYDSSGTEQWKSVYSGTLGAFDAAAAIALDGNGNVYVAGTSEGGRFPTTIKYNNSGVQQWVNVHTVINGSGGANALVLDAQANVYITGSAGGDFLTVKYNTNGKQQWSAAFNGGANVSDESRGIALDKNNNVYITGSTVEEGFQEDLTTIKYSTNGVQQWMQRFSGTAGGNDRPSAIAIDSKDNVLITGQQAAFSAQSDMLTIQYSANGRLNWMQLFNGQGNGSDFSRALAIDNSDNVYIAGASTGIGGNLDYTIIKYAVKGELTWEKRFNGSANGTDIVNAIAVDGIGNVFVTGLSEGIVGIDITTVRYISGATNDFNYVLTQSEGGDWSCPPPKCDCTKIKGGAALRSVSRSALFDEFKNAVENNTIQQFFNTNKWKQLFPHLIGETFVLQLLQTGAVKLVQRTNNTSGEIFYIAIPISADTTSFNASDAVFAIDITP